jgi:Probable cobalt transporter subunit (CbtA)
MALVLRRGLLAGLVAGLVSGVYLLLVGEPVIDQAIRLEAAASGGAPAAEVFSRGTQRLGLVGAATLYGLAVGGVFAILYQLLEPRMAAGTAWDKAVRLAAAGFGTLFLVPFFEYPSNPPGVGDPATAGTRTRLYLAAIALSAVISLLAWLAAHRLAELGVERWRRQLAVGAGYLVAVGLAYAVLPEVSQRVNVPAEVLWEARLASASGQALLWACLDAAFGALGMRAERRAAGATAAPASA